MKASMPIKNISMTVNEEYSIQNNSNFVCKNIQFDNGLKFTLQSNIETSKFCFDKIFNGSLSSEQSSMTEKFSRKNIQKGKTINVTSHEEKKNAASVISKKDNIYETSSEQIVDIDTSECAMSQKKIIDVDLSPLLGNTSSIDISEQQIINKVETKNMVFSYADFKTAKKNSLNATNIALNEHCSTFAGQKNENLAQSQESTKYYGYHQCNRKRASAGDHDDAMTMSIKSLSECVENNDRSVVTNSSSIKQNIIRINTKNQDIYKPLKHVYRDTADGCIKQLKCGFDSIILSNVSRKTKKHGSNTAMSKKIRKIAENYIDNYKKIMNFQIKVTKIQLETLLKRINCLKKYKLKRFS